MSSDLPPNPLLSPCFSVALLERTGNGPVYYRKPKSNISHFPSANPMPLNPFPGLFPSLFILLMESHVMTPSGMHRWLSLSLSFSLSRSVSLRPSFPLSLSLLKTGVFLHACRTVLLVTCAIRLRGVCLSPIISKEKEEGGERQTLDCVGRNPGQRLVTVKGSARRGSFASRRRVTRD